jgi:hypothetical protein
MAVVLKIHNPNPRTMERYERRLRLAFYDRSTTQHLGDDYMSVRLTFCDSRTQYLEGSFATKSIRSEIIIPQDELHLLNGRGRRGHQHLCQSPSTDHAVYELEDALHGRGTRDWQTVIQLRDFDTKERYTHPYLTDWNGDTLVRFILRRSLPHEPGPENRTDKMLRLLKKLLQLQGVQFRIKNAQIPDFLHKATSWRPADQHKLLLKADIKSLMVGHDIVSVAHAFLVLGAVTDYDMKTDGWRTLYDDLCEFKV